MMRFLMLLLLGAWAAPGRAESPYAPSKNGPPTSPDFFPIAVWVQAPQNAERYRAIGINTYVGLWSGPTAAQLDALEKAQMHVVCHYKESFANRKSIIAWMHGDEPDNAQSLGKGKGYGPPILPEKVVGDYRKLKEADPTRPVLLNLGQGVAYDNYIGRGVRRGKLEDYAKYVEGADVVSFDIYPANHDKPEIAGNLWQVPKGVTRLREWSKDQKVVWNCIETTHIDEGGRRPTPREVRAEVWMSIIHGSRGIIYFAHQFKPKFIEAGLLADAEIAKAVGSVNAEIKSLATAINAQSSETSATAASSNKDVPVATMCREAGGNLHVFAVAMRDGETTATFTIPDTKTGTIEVLGEARTIPLKEGAFADTFKSYDVHLYRLAKK